jgi:hypothetical protein
LLRRDVAFGGVLGRSFVAAKIVGSIVGGFSISTWDTNMALADAGIRATKPAVIRKFTT